MQVIKSRKYGKLYENLMSLFTLQGLNYILPLITVPYLTRILGAENYGKTLFASSIIIYFQIISDYGFSMSATRNISINRENKSKVELIFSSVILVKVIIAIIGSLALGILIIMLPRLKNEFLLYIFTYMGVVGNAIFPIWLFQGMEEMKYITYINVIVKLVSTLCIFIFIKNSNDYILLPLINSIVLILISILSLVFINKKMKIRYVNPKINNIIKELKDGWHLFITTFFSNVMANSGNLIIGAFLGDKMVGYYGAIDKIAKAIISMFSPITTAIFPHVSRVLKDNKTKGIKEIIKFFRIVMLLSIISITLLFILSKFIIFTICGEEFVKYHNILNMEGIWLIFSILNNFIGIQFLIGIGQGKYYSKSFFISGISMLLFDLLLIAKLGIYTIPLGMILGEVILTLTMIFYICRYRLYK